LSEIADKQFMKEQQLETKKQMINITNPFLESILALDIVPLVEEYT
jgi:hypothetical protein